MPSFHYGTRVVFILKGGYYMKKVYTKEQKDEILQRYWSGETVESISADTGVAKSTVYKWIKSIAKKPKAVNMTDFRILKQRCETLEKMVEILQMSPCTVSAPLHDRYEVIKDLSDTYSISLLCKTLMVAKGSYFNHLKAKEDTVYVLKKKQSLRRFSTRAIKCLAHERSMRF